jgi:chromosome segregation ATPase
VLLVAALAGGGWLAWHLVQVNDAWQEHSQQWEALARKHGEELAQARADLEAEQSELAAVREQLATAQDRITQLADEKAQFGDEAAFQQQLADYQQRVSKAAGQVATALATCIDGQEELIGYIENADQYDPGSLAAYRQDVEGYCDDARDANASLQAELAQ